MSSRLYRIHEDHGGGFGVDINHADAIKVRSCIPNPTPNQIINEKYRHAHFAMSEVNN